MKMNRGFISTILAVLLMGIFAAVGYAYSYGMYYASYADQDTAFVIMNSGGDNTYYTLKVYDAYGSLIDAVSGDLDPFESDYRILSDIAGTTDMSWGLALLETPGMLTIGVETFIGERWMASDNVIDPIPDTKDYSYYWYGLNYSNTSSQNTGIAIINPNGSPAAATLKFYDAQGQMKYTADVVLDPHETEYYSTSDILTVSNSMWGVLDVRGTMPLIVTAEYFTGDGTLMNVDQITHAYFNEY